MSKLAMVQQTGIMQVFVQYWAEGKVASGSCGKVTHIVEFLSTMKWYEWVNCQFLGNTSLINRKLFGTGILLHYS